MNDRSMDVSGGAAADASAARARVMVWDTARLCEIEAYEGESLMIALKRAGAALLAVCGGKAACGTCKVALAPAWLARVSPAGPRELRLLRHIGAGQDERLSCQIPLTADLNGLEVCVRE